MASSNASLATPTTGGTKTGFFGGAVLAAAPPAAAADGPRGELAAEGLLLLLLLPLLVLVLLVLELVLRLRFLELVRRLFPPAAVDLPSSDWSLPPPLLPSAPSS